MSSKLESDVCCRLQVAPSGESTCIFMITWAKASFYIAHSCAEHSDTHADIWCFTMLQKARNHQNVPTPATTWFLGPKLVHNQNSIVIFSSIYAGLMPHLFLSFFFAGRCCHLLPHATCSHYLTMGHKMPPPPKKITSCQRGSQSPHNTWLLGFHSNCTQNSISIGSDVFARHVCPAMMSGWCFL